MEDSHEQSFVPRFVVAAVAIRDGASAKLAGGWHDVRLCPDNLYRRFEREPTQRRHHTGRSISPRRAPTGGVGTPYSITLAAGATLTESADIAAINLKGTDTLTINGQGINGQGGAVLNGAGAFRGFFAYSGNLTIEKSWGLATFH